jgi:hypothetical protein
LWKDLFEFALSRAQAVTLRIEQNRARAGGALVKSEDMGHNLQVLRLRIIKPMYDLIW